MTFGSGPLGTLNDVTSAAWYGKFPDLRMIVRIFPAGIVVRADSVVPATDLPRGPVKLAAGEEANDCRRTGSRFRGCLMTVPGSAPEGRPVVIGFFAVQPVHRAVCRRNVVTGVRAGIGLRGRDQRVKLVAVLPNTGVPARRGAGYESPVVGYVRRRSVPRAGGHEHKPKLCARLKTFRNQRPASRHGRRGPGVGLRGGLRGGEQASQQGERQQDGKAAASIRRAAAGAPR